MTPEEEKFLNEIADQLKEQPGFNDVEELFFPLRFDKNRPTLYKHTDIAENLMRPEGFKLPPDFYSKSITQTVQNIVNIMIGRLEKKYTPIKAKKETIKPAIKGLYAAEMRADGVDVDSLLNKEQGEKGNWKVVYNWLWNYKYPRWLEANSWELLREKAQSPAHWIQFLTKEDQQKVLDGDLRGAYLKRPPTPEPEIPPIIPVNEKLRMRIDLEYPQYQLLLFNRSEAGTVLHCPSFGYAVNSIIEQPPILLPQKESWAGQTNQFFLFQDKGQEEFLGIVLKEPLNLPWLIPQEQDVLPKWEGERVMQLFSHLQQSGDWQVFYQSFDVVEQETEA
ncbi:hypothetical protein [Planktothrix sp. FACHB-1365]|uniref:hypothetical protein n=1 Tax=Planktothrix sp. FACHB-1365 TaxID=2692855 RepID=UPI0016886377|nr:hypothetical protein [Planktothrix sp. FACHB-1365]MBD2481158.1 hypothetical protein [Planktothrix sp. FACHB-1365]